MSDHLRRYMQGEYQQVWQELVALGDQVREPDIYPDALTVARETMRRVRVNIEMLIPRLEHVGYQFGYGWAEPLIKQEEHDLRDANAPGGVYEQFGFPSLTEEEITHSRITDWIAEAPRLFVPATHETRLQLQDFDAHYGPLPLSLYAWYEQIAEVNFVGKHPATWQQPDDSAWEGKPQLFIYTPDTPAPTWMPPEEDMLNIGFLQPHLSRQEQYTLIRQYAHRHAPHDIDPLHIASSVYLSKRFAIRPTLAFFALLAPDECFKHFASGGGGYGVRLPIILIHEDNGKIVSTASCHQG